MGFRDRRRQPRSPGHPLIHEGVLYLSADQSRVFAIDALTGKSKWAFDPKLGDDVERVYCCGSNNRGVALWGDLVFVGTMDARMVALNKDTGAVVWETEVIDWEQGYSITGAPLVVKDLVLTGVAGGEFGIRGFVKAFDAKTGAERWTAYTIPGPGEPGNETWPGDTWKNGGGPTWTTGVYDPNLNLVYWNTGTPRRGTATCARATTNGRRRRSLSMPIREKSRGAFSTLPGTAGTTTR